MIAVEPGRLRLVSIDRRIVDLVVIEPTILP